MPAIPAPDRNLLLGVLALQNHLIDRDTLIGALKSWAREPGRSLGELLVERGDLSPPERASLEDLLAAQLARQMVEPVAAEKSYKTSPVASIAHVSQTIDLFADAELAASLQAVGVSARLVERSLAPSSRPGTIAATLLDGQHSSEATSEARHPGQAAGRFRPLKLHARGGLGEVFLAVDDELHREVALKEIQAKFAADPDARARFLREAEITGGLEHPGIVPVYGLGAYPDGRPYYAMRFIRGESLREAIAKHHQPAPAEGRDPGERDLALRKLLGRFLSACNAIDYAHNRGVIHRDIKPDNILIGPFGETLVVDWGLARAQGRDELRAAEGETTLHVPSGDSTSTRQGAILGTPAFMSPEQALGWNDLLTPATDIYSLGATLYMLLTGQAPITGAKDVASLLQRVQTGDFPKPRTIASEIPEPLEAICLKAMATKASQRYASARAFADDIEAWLADQPVSAYDEPWWSQAGRWVRRNRTLVAGAATASGVALVALAIGVVMLSLYNEELRVARDRADADYKLARSAVEKYLVRVTNDRRLKAEGFESLRKDLLRDAGEFYEQFLHREATKPDVLPDSVAATFRLAEISQDVESAEAALRYVDRALALNERWRAAQPNYFAPPAAEVILQVKRGVLLTELGEHAKAIDTYRLAAEKSELLAPSPNPTTQFARRMMTADIQKRIGEALYWSDQREESLQALIAAGQQFDAILAQAPQLLVQSSSSDMVQDQSLEPRLLAPFAAMADDKPLVQRLREDAVRAQVQRKAIQAEVLADLGRGREALVLMSEAVRDFEPLVAGEPDWSPFPSEWVALLGNHGNLALAEGDVSTATADFSAARKGIDPLLVRHPDVSEYQALAANILHNQAVLTYQQGDIPAALAGMRRSLAMLRSLHAHRPELYEHQANLAKSLGDLARIERVAGETAQIEAQLREAIGLQEGLARGNRSAAEHQLQLASTHVSLAEWFGRQNRFAEARDELQSAELQAAKVAKRMPGLSAAAELRIALRLSLAAVWMELGEGPAAKQAMEEASGILEGELKRRPKNIALLKLKSSAAMQMGAMAEASRDAASAEKHYRAAIEIRLQLAALPGAALSAGAELGSAIHSLGRSLVQGMKFKEGRKEYDLAIAALRPLVKQAPSSAALRHQLSQTLNSRAMAAWIEFDVDAAVADEREAIAILEALVAEHPQEILYQLDEGGAWSSLGEMERTRPDPVAALAAYCKALEILAPHGETIARQAASRAAYRNARYRRAEIFVAQKRFREALADLTVAAPIAGGMTPEIRGLRILALRMVGEHAEALQELELLIPIVRKNTDQLASLAMLCTVAANDLAGDDSLGEDERGMWCERYAASAVALLGVLQETGFFQQAAARDFVDKDPRIAVLRARADYQAWRKGIERNREPPP